MASGLNRLIDRRVWECLSTIGLDSVGISKFHAVIEGSGELIQGPPGKSLHTGIGPPPANLGSPADTYVDLNTGAVFVKE